MRYNIEQLIKLISAQKSQLGKKFHVTFILREKERERIKEEFSRILKMRNNLYTVLILISVSRT